MDTLCCALLQREGGRGREGEREGRVCVCVYRSGDDVRQEGFLGYKQSRGQGEVDRGITKVTDVERRREKKKETDQNSIPFPPLLLSCYTHDRHVAKLKR